MRADRDHGRRAGQAKGREGFWALFEALERLSAPSVVVVQDLSGHPERVAFCGEVMATMAQRLGAAGYVTDGTVRDLHEVRALGLPYFASGVCVSHGNFWIEDVGVDVELDGQVVRTGDLLHGEANGIVVVPREVLARATARRRRRPPQGGRAARPRALRRLHRRGCDAADRLPLRLRSVPPTAPRQSRANQRSTISRVSTLGPLEAEICRAFVA